MCHSYRKFHSSLHSRLMGHAQKPTSSHTSTLRANLTSAAPFTSACAGMNACHATASTA